MNQTKKSKRIKQKSKRTKRNSINSRSISKSIVAAVDEQANKTTKTQRNKTENKKANETKKQINQTKKANEPNKKANEPNKIEAAEALAKIAATASVCIIKDNQNTCDTKKTITKKIH